MLKDTIVAQATASGKSGINIIRISGSDSLKIAQKIFYNKDFKCNIKNNVMYFGNINLGLTKDVGYCVYFKAPKSFTGEDVVEFHCHGGYQVSKTLIERCLECGARLASPGEFSKRAFLNGKMTLDQAEGVIDLINAETEGQMRAGNNLAHGDLYKKISFYQEKLTDILSEIEVNLDYPEHDIEYETKENIKVKLVEILNDIEKLLTTEKTGRIIKNGIDIAIVGRTNVGKSSLLNALINFDQAIVTDVEGTTRDVINASIEYKGIKFNFYDTAGLRETTDKIEKIGIEKSKQLQKNCDIIIYVFDGSKKLSEEEQEILGSSNKNQINIINKNDSLLEDNKNKNAIYISAKNKNNIEDIKEKIYEIVLKNHNESNNFMLTNARHVEVLKECKNMLEMSIENIENVTLDCVALDAKSIWEKLGEITGNTATDIIIDKIFSKFCLGK